MCAPGLTFQLECACARELASTIASATFLVLGQGRSSRRVPYLRESFVSALLHLCGPLEAVVKHPPLAEWTESMVLAAHQGWQSIGYYAILWALH